MQQLATQQLASIHSMLSAGHRNLRIERHSLLLWGASGGVIILLSDHILTAEQIPNVSMRAIAWLFFLVLTLSGVALIDWYFMRRAKQARDEAWSFIHRQVLKVWWLLMSLGVLLNFAMSFYGGGYMIFAAWVVLAGLGLYVHGLFSEELLEWIGVLIIAIGIGMLAFSVDIISSKWVAASTLGLGLPLLSTMLDQGKQRSFLRRLAQSTAWLFCVLLLPLAAHQFNRVTLPLDTPVVSIDEFSLQPSKAQIVAVPAGTMVPLKVELSGDVFRASHSAVLPLELKQPIEIMMNNGVATGEWRFPGAQWAHARGSIWVRIPSINVSLLPQTGPVINAGLNVFTKQ